MGRRTRRPSRTTRWTTTEHSYALYTVRRSVSGLVEHGLRVATAHRQRRKVAGTHSPAGLAPSTISRILASSSAVKVIWFDCRFSRMRSTFFVPAIGMLRYQQSLTAPHAHVLALRSDPGDGQLTRRAALGLGDRAQLMDEGEILVKVLLGEPRVLEPAVLAVHRQLSRRRA